MLDFLKRRKLQERTPQEVAADTKAVNTLGINYMVVDEDTEKELTPNMLMFYAYLITENLPEIRTGYIAYTNFLVGKGLRSKDATVRSYLKKNMYLQSEMKKFCWNYLTVANAYLQLFWEERAAITDNAKPKLKYVQTIYDSSRVFYNLDAERDEEFWLYQIHYTQGSSFFSLHSPMNQKAYKFNTQFYWIKYALSQMWQGSYEYCMQMGKDEIRHFKNEYTRNPYYGFSSLMAGYNYGKAANEIILNSFRKAKFQALGKKIITLGTAERPATIEDVNRFNKDFYSEGKQIVIVNKPISMVDMAYQGMSEDQLEVLDYLRKSLMSGSVPTFLTAFADDFNNRSLSDDSLLGFFMQLDSDRNRIIGFWNKIISLLVYGDEVHDCGLFFDAPVAKKEEGDTNISNQHTGGDSISQTSTTECVSDVDDKINNTLSPKFVESVFVGVSENLPRNSSVDKSSLILSNKILPVIEALGSSGKVGDVKELEINSKLLDAKK